VNVTVDEAVHAALKALPPRPDEDAKQTEKKAYSEKMSAAVAVAIGQALRERGMDEARPAEPGELDLSGAERRMAGGIGAKKVDVTWATEESGLLCAVSVKTINWRDKKTKNYQKNLTNRRSDLLLESVTLHRRFPYAVLFGLFFLDKGAAHDGTAKRRSTVENAHPRLKLFTGRNDPAGRDEQYERLYVILVDANQFAPTTEIFEVGFPAKPLTFEEVMAELIRQVAERNPDFYEVQDGKLVKVPS
jgi:hypothetical protein